MDMCAPKSRKKKCFESTSWQGLLDYKKGEEIETVLMVTKETIVTMAWIHF
jgi:hypothetical protein